VKSRKTYQGINPELLYDEVKDFVSQQGLVLDEARLETYSTPGGSSHVVRGTLTFKQESGGQQNQCFRAHVVGSATDETKLMLDIDESLFPADKIAAVEEDLDFIFGACEVKPL
jgi:hypothetical protein